MNRQPSKGAGGMPPVIPIGGRRGPGGGGPMAARMSAEKPKNTRRTAMRLLHYIGRSGWLLITLLLIMLAVTAADLLGPFFQAKAIDTITLKEGQLAVEQRAVSGRGSLLVRRAALLGHGRGEQIMDLNAVISQVCGGLSKLLPGDAVPALGRK